MFVGTHRHGADFVVVGGGGGCVVVVAVTAAVVVGVGVCGVVLISNYSVQTTPTPDLFSAHLHTAVAVCPSTASLPCPHGTHTMP